MYGHVSHLYRQAQKKNQEILFFKDPFVLELIRLLGFCVYTTEKEKKGHQRKRKSSCLVVKSKFHCSPSAHIVIVICSVSFSIGIFLLSFLKKGERKQKRTSSLALYTADWMELMEGGIGLSFVYLSFLHKMA